MNETDIKNIPSNIFVELMEGHPLVSYVVVLCSVLLPGFVSI
jgi:hypothetical protein